MKRQRQTCSEDHVLHQVGYTRGGVILPRCRTETELYYFLNQYLYHEFLEMPYELWVIVFQYLRVLECVSVESFSPTYWTRVWFDIEYPLTRNSKAWWEQVENVLESSEGTFVENDVNDTVRRSLNGVSLFVHYQMHHTRHQLLRTHGDEFEEMCLIRVKLKYGLVVLHGTRERNMCKLNEFKFIN